MGRRKIVSSLLSYIQSCVWLDVQVKIKILVSFFFIFVKLIQEYRVRTKFYSGGKELNSGCKTDKMLTDCNFVAFSMSQDCIDVQIGNDIVAFSMSQDCIDVQIGNDIGNVEVVRWQLKSQFDRNIITHYETQVEMVCS